MAELILFYSFGGTTKARAQALAAETGADLVQVDYPRPPGLLGAFFKCPAAMGQKSAKALRQTPEGPLDFSKYGGVTIMGPIWAGNPAPPVNNLIRMLPPGTAVKLVFCSGGGVSAKGKVTALVQACGCTVASYTDIAGGSKPAAQK